MRRSRCFAARFTSSVLLGGRAGRAVGPSAAPGRARIAALVFAVEVALLRRQRALPPPVVGAAGTTVAGSPRSRWDLLPDRRHVHAGRPARDACGRGKTVGGRLDRRRRATLLKLFSIRAPKTVFTALGLGLGRVAAAAFPQIVETRRSRPCAPSWRRAALFARRRRLRGGRPDPVPHVFGYHELVHVLTLVAAASQYAAIAF